MLEKRRYSAEECNTKIIKAMKKRIIKDRPDLAPDGFNMIYQQFDEVIEDSDGKLYRCVGWVPPHRDSFIEVSEYKPS